MSDHTAPEYEGPGKERIVPTVTVLFEVSDSAPFSVYLQRPSTGSTGRLTMN